MRARCALAAVAAAAAVVGAVASCGDGRTCELELPEACCLLDGGHSHRVSIWACADDDDCPSGTYCGLSARRCPPGNGCCRDAPAGRCVPGTSFRADALISGWGVRGLALDKETTSAGGTVFKWEVLPQARLTQCALFACIPVIRTVGCGETAPSATIVNYDRCVLAEKTFGGSGVFDVADASVFVDGPVESSCGPAEQPFFPTTLVAGCWVYDESSLIGATELVPLGIAEVSGATSVDFAPCAVGGGLEGATCEQELQNGHAVLGTCNPGGRCGARCLDDCDCSSIGLGGTTYYACAKDPGAWVGVCDDAPSPVTDELCDAQH